MVSCSFFDEKRESGVQHQPIVWTLSEKQQSAFDALIKIQVNTDEKNQLYSTFANTNHDCSTADTSFVLTQEELAFIMQKFVELKCQKTLSQADRNELAKLSVLAQEKYTVLLCINHDDISYADGLPFVGTWIIPNILGRRDVVMFWSEN